MRTFKSTFTARIAIEVIAVVAIAETAVMFILPVVAPHASESVEALLDTTLLSLMAGPIVAWRVRRLAESAAMTEGGEPDRVSKRRAVLLASVLTVVGLLMTAWSTSGLYTNRINEARATFARKSDRIRDEFTKRMNLYVYGLKGVRGLYAGSKSVERGEFRGYTSSGACTTEFPGALALGYMQRVRRTDVGAFVEAQRADEAPEFSICGETQGEQLLVVKFLEPGGAGRLTPGRDMGAEAPVAEAAERAMQTGDAALTSSLEPFTSSGSHEFLYMLPVYRNGSDTTTVQSRTEACVGFAFIPFELDQALAGVLEDTGSLLDFEVYDGASPSSGTLLFDGDGCRSINTSSAPSEFCADKALEIGGRTWSVRVRSLPAFEAAYRPEQAYAAGAAGVLLSLFLGLMVLGMGTSRARALALARAMTVDLQRAKESSDAALARVARFREALDIHAVVSVTDRDGNIVEVNDQFCALSKYSRDELIGQNQRIVRSGQHPAAFWAQVWATLGKGDIWRGELCNRAKDGSLYWVDSTIVPFRDGAGRIERFVGILVDVSERKRAAEELVRAREAAESANRAKSEFLANMSHEIRTPLTAILGYTDLLAEDGDVSKAPERRLETIATIRRSGEHLLTVVNDILDVSKIEAGKLVIEDLECSLPVLLAEIESLLRPRAVSKSIRFGVAAQTSLPEVIRTDPTRLRQILLNLGGNAVKFTESGSVKIEAHALEGDRLRIDIVDTGPGLTAEQAGALFRPFTQADASVTRKHGGTGLGLTICKRLAEMMGGTVTLERTAPGQGSVFRLELPLRAAPGTAWTRQLRSQKRSLAAGEASMNLKGRILLAEDGPENQRLISFHLRRAGAEVDIVENGRIALETLEKAGTGHYDLLVTDMQMPELDGYSLARRLREKGHAIPIIALTAHAMAEDRKKCTDAGCDDYATKPIDRDRLLATCAAWMGRAGGVKRAA